MYKAYASYFASYLISKVKNLDRIRRIILFGSVARGDVNNESDVDIFIEINKKTKKLEEEIEKILESFYESREALLFKARGINNKINIIVGELSDWKELKKSIESTGIQLYGPLESNGIAGKKFLIIHWDKIAKNRGAFLNKIYGFRIKDKRYKGLLENLDGKRLGKSCIIIPIQNKEQVLDLIEKHRANARIVEVYK